MEGIFTVRNKIIYYQLNNELHYTVRAGREWLNYITKMMKYFNIPHYQPSPVKVGSMTRYSYPFYEPTHPTVVTPHIIDLLCMQMLLGYINVGLSNIVLVDGQWVLLYRNSVRDRLFGDTPQIMDDQVFDRHIRAFVAKHSMSKLKYKYPTQSVTVARRHSQFR